MRPRFGSAIADLARERNGRSKPLDTSDGGGLALRDSLTPTRNAIGLSSLVGE